MAWQAERSGGVRVSFGQGRKIEIKNPHPDKLRPASSRTLRKSVPALAEGLPPSILPLKINSQKNFEKVENRAFRAAIGAA
jgi:hypothetical protein